MGVSEECYGGWWGVGGMNTCSIGWRMEYVDLDTQLIFSFCRFQLSRDQSSTLIIELELPWPRTVRVYGLICGLNV